MTTKKTKKTFEFAVHGTSSLSVDEIWPDGDAPEDPTVEDVIAVVARAGGLSRILRGWDLDHDLRLVIVDDAGRRGAA